MRRLLLGFVLCTSPTLAQTIEQQTLPSLDEGLEIIGITLENRNMEVLNSNGDVLLKQVEIETKEEVSQGGGAVLRGLDRVSTDLVDFELNSGENHLFGPLLVTLKECRYPRDNPSGDAYAYLTVEDRLLGSSVFEGWMIASSPALNAMDHSRYDIWVLSCKTSAADETAPAE